MRTLSSLLASILLVAACGEPDDSEAAIPAAATPPSALATAWRAASEGDHDTAREAYREATAEAPQSVEAWSGLAREALRTDRVDEAREAAARAVELAPESADAHELAGLAALEGGDAAAAAERLARALELDPERARVRFPLARALERSGRRSDAIDAYHASADAGARAARALTAAARVRIDALNRPGRDELGVESPDEAELAAAVAELDRAERLAEGDADVLGAIVAQRRRVDEKREPMDERERAASIARNAGILGALSGTTDYRSLFGGNAPSLDQDVLGARRIGDGSAGLRGTTPESGPAYGIGGLSPRGSGPGGGGTSEGTIGLGNLGMIGRGGGGGSGYGRGGGAGGLRGRPSPSPSTVRLGTATSRGVAPEVARRVVQRQLGRVRQCYEVELQRDSALSGSMTMQLTVAGDGSVSGARVAASTLGNARVEDCVLRAGHAMRFPAPEATPASVTASFTMSPSAD